MAKEKLQKGWEKSAETPKKERLFWNKVKKWAEIFSILALLWYWAYKFWDHDIQKSKERKEADIEKYWEFRVTPDGATYQFGDGLDGGPDPDSLVNITLDDILEYNHDIIGIDATRLESIMLWEESLKTTKNWISKYDERLELNWVDRNPYSESLIWRFLGKIKEWSYWPYQVQPEAIDKYKNDSTIYNDLCKRIAKFQLPDKNWEYVPLHEQLWLTVDEMIEQIQNHKIYMFAWGGRFLVAYGIILIDQISREVVSKIDWYNWFEGYNKWSDNTKSLETEKDTIDWKLKLKYPELTRKDNAIMAPYILFNKWEVSYNKIWDLFNSDVFVNGMVSAYWCMDYINNVQNSNYLYLLSLLELNEWFDNPTWDLNIVMPTWRFWPTTVNLVNKYFGTNFDPNSDKDRAEAKKFMDNLSPDELQSKKDVALDSFEKNMRKLYTLNPEDIHWINQEQAKYLSECLDITFNHMYAGIVVFSDFVNNNFVDKSDTLNQLRTNYVQRHDKSSLDTIKKIMTDEGTFTSFTWLGKPSYLKWIKYYLCPTLLGATDWIYQTWWVIPVIQDNLWWTRMSNEQNSIFRFTIWVSQEQIAQQLREQWVEYIIQPWDENIDSLREIMWSKKQVREYLQTCKTINWDTIASPQDIPDELVLWMLRWSDWANPLFENWEWFYEWDTIYIKYLWLEDIWHKILIDKPVTKTIKKTVTKKKKSKIVESTVKLCTVNSSGILTMQESWTFQEILYTLSKTNPEIKQLLESLKWSEINSQSEITQDIIKKIIGHPDWSKWSNINRVNKGQGFIIVRPLNY